MKSSFYRAIAATIILAIVLCVFYPLAITAVGSLFFEDKATGQLITQGEHLVGSRLIGQNFSQTKYFQGRPSAAGEKGYDAAASSGSNLGPTNQKLKTRIETDVKRILDENPGAIPGEIPVDLITTSGSGLDPHISPEAAKFQIPRIAKVRNITEKVIKELVDANTEESFFGGPAVSVLELNLALDACKIP